MLERSLAAVAFLVLAAFIGVLLWKLPRPDLGAVALLTLALAAYDFFRRDS